MLKQFYCPHAHIVDDWCIRIREKTPEISLVTYTICNTILTLLTHKTGEVVLFRSSFDVHI